MFTASPNETEVMIPESRLPSPMKWSAVTFPVATILLLALKEVVGLVNCIVLVVVGLLSVTTCNPELVTVLIPVSKLPSPTKVDATTFPVTSTLADAVILEASTFPDATIRPETTSSAVGEMFI